MAAIESELGPSEAQPFYAGLKDNEVILRDGAVWVMQTAASVAVPLLRAMRQEGDA